VVLAFVLPVVAFRERSLQGTHDRDEAALPLGRHQ
jgi:hypothetical protein